MSHDIDHVLSPSDIIIFSQQLNQFVFVEFLREFMKIFHIWNMRVIFFLYIKKHFVESAYKSINVFYL